MEKSKYIEPEVEIIEFDSEDFITASTGDNEASWNPGW